MFSGTIQCPLLLESHGNQEIIINHKSPILIKKKKISGIGIKMASGGQDIQIYQTLTIQQWDLGYSDYTASMFQPVSPIHGFNISS